MSQTSKYEILYIIRPNIDEAAKAELVARFDAVLTDNGTAEDAKAIDEFDRLAKISNDILRHMIVKVEAFA